MKINKELNKNIWDILQKIKGKTSLSKKLKILWKQGNNHDDFSFEKGEELALAELEKLTIIKTKIEPALLFPEHLAGYAEAYTYRPPKDNGKALYLIINQIKFDELYKEYEKFNIKKDQPDKKIDYILNLPTKASWEEIEIKFKNHYEIDIYFKNKFKKSLKYEDLGFYRKKTKDNKKTSEWMFLYALSVIQNQKENEATVDSMAVSMGKMLETTINKNNCEQIKSKLSKKLIEIFNIEESPFYSYKDIGYYKTKFKLLPVPEIRGSGEVYISKRNELNENQDFEKI